MHPWYVFAMLRLMCRYNDSGRLGDGERPALPAVPPSKLPGHSVQRDTAGSYRHEHAFHVAQYWHQDQGNVSGSLTLMSSPSPFTRAFCVFLLFSFLFSFLTRSPACMQWNQTLYVKAWRYVMKKKKKKLLKIMHTPPSKARAWIWSLKLRNRRWMCEPLCHLNFSKL